MLKSMTNSMVVLSELYVGDMTNEPKKICQKWPFLGIFGVVYPLSDVVVRKFDMDKIFVTMGLQ